MFDSSVLRFLVLHSTRVDDYSLLYIYDFHFIMYLLKLHLFTEIDFKKILWRAWTEFLTCTRSSIFGQDKTIFANTDETSKSVLALSIVAHFINAFILICKKKLVWNLKKNVKNVQTFNFLTLNLYTILHEVV